MSKARQLADLGNVYDDGALSNRNLIINGAMQVAQRGTSFAAIGSSTYTLDRWRGQSRAGSVVNVSKVDNVDVSGRIMSVLQHEVTTPATDGLTLQNHFVEDGSISLLGQTVTVSCWARVTVGSATIHQGIEVDNGLGGAYYDSPTTLTSSFQRIVFTTTLSGYTTSISYTHLRYQLYITGASAHTVQITGVQLEVGDTATPFEHRSYGQELALCQRYYQKYADPTLRGVHGGGQTASRMGMTLPVIMRVAPSATLTGTISIYDGGNSAGMTSFLASYMSPDSVEFDGYLTNSLTTGRALVAYKVSGSSQISLDAEL